METSQYSTLFLRELKEEIIPFWEKNSLDIQHGGYYTCLDRNGNVFDTDKFVWLQGRQIWMFSQFYQKLEKKPEFLRIAESGAEFLQKYGRNQAGHFYFSLDATGKPLVSAYNIFSDCFASMGFASLYHATQKEDYHKIALDTFQSILSRKNNTKGQYEKKIQSNHSLQNFTLSMILSKMIEDFDGLVDRSKIKEIQDEVIQQIIHQHYQADHGIILENVLPDGSIQDSFDGRLVNPGHGLEALWFLLDIAHQRNDTVLMEKITSMMLSTIEYAWDKEYGGIFYFMDVYQKPLQQLEWNQKLWWVHIEAMIAFAKAYQYTQNKTCLAWFEKIHAYTWNHFRDQEYGGEWFGYLDQSGKRLLDLKGGKWKGCFHVPRGLLTLAKTFEAI